MTTNHSQLCMAKQTANTTVTLLTRGNTSEQCKETNSSLPGHNSASNTTNPGDSNMITRISSSLIEEINRLSTQRHKLALEAHVADPGDIVITITPVILEEECNGCGSVPVGAVQVEFENVGAGNCMGDFEGLGWGEVRGGSEVEVVAVFEEFHGFRGGGGWSCPEENGMDFYLAGEAVV